MRTGREIPENRKKEGQDRSRRIYQRGQIEKDRSRRTDRIGKGEDKTRITDENHRTMNDWPSSANRTPRT